MAYTNTESEWGSIAKTLHWLIGSLIVLQLIMGWLFTLRAFPGPVQSQLVLNFHIPVGVTVLGLGLIRVLWRFANLRPPLPSNLTWWERFLANGSHTYLYMAMIAMPLTGWVATSGFGAPVNWFGGIGLPAMIATEAKEGGRPLTVLFAQMHYWVAVGLTAVFVLHVAGALRHHIGLKDATLKRMVPKGWLKG